MTDMTGYEKELLAFFVHAAIERVGGKEDDIVLFNMVYAMVEKAYTDPCLKLIPFRCELVPEGQEPAVIPIETKAALWAHGWFLGELEFQADLMRWWPKGLTND